MKRLQLSFVVASCLLGLTIETGAQTKTIIVGEGVRGAMYLPAYIAEEKGFFRKRDLDTRLVTFSRSNDINALVSGDIQFNLTAPDKVVHSALGGFPVKMVMGTARGLNLAWWFIHPSVPRLTYAANPWRSPDFPACPTPACC